jgi:hypothetical protein
MNMIIIENFIKLSREERRKHLDLTEQCCERGGNSTNHKGVLAQYLNTTIPSGRILLCHSCHNSNCSNPKHLYWGTDKDNVKDARDNGTWKNPWDYAVEKYGYDEACRRNAHNGNKFGKGNKDKPKSEEHKLKIAEGMKGKTNAKK